MPDNTIRVPKHYAKLCELCTIVDCILIAEQGAHSGYMFGSACGQRSTVYYIEANASMEKILHTIHDDLILNPTIADDPTDPRDHTIHGFALNCMEYFLKYAGAALDKAHTAIVTYVEINPDGSPKRQHFQFPLDWTPPLYIPNYHKPNVEQAWAKTKQEIATRKARANLTKPPDHITSFVQTVEADGTSYTTYIGRD